MQGKTKVCKNCKTEFSKTDAQKARLETDEKYNVQYCTACGVVHSFKKYIYTLTLSSPIFVRLLKQYSAIKRQVTYLKLNLAAREFINQHPDFLADFDKLMAEKQCSLGELADFLIREQRFKAATEQTQDVAALLKKLVAASFFKFLSSKRNSISNNEAAELILKSQPNFFETCDTNNEDLKTCDLKTAFGHYNGSSGNCAKKVATRLWRALRFLGVCNDLLKRGDPQVQLLDLDYNKDLDYKKLITRVMPASRAKVEILLDSVKNLGFLPECFFTVEITRKETKYVVPIIGREVTFKKGDGVYKKTIKKGKSRKLFLKDFANNEVETRKLKPKKFEYLAIMNIQRADKVAEILKKMGDNIWLANVYTLSLPKKKDDRKSDPSKISTSVKNFTKASKKKREAKKGQGAKTKRASRQIKNE